MPVDILTARNASTLFVLRTVRRQAFPTQVTRHITAQRLVAGSHVARCGDAITFVLIAVEPNRGRLWEEPSLEPQHLTT